MRNRVSFLFLGGFLVTKKRNGLRVYLFIALLALSSSFLLTGCGIGEDDNMACNDTANYTCAYFAGSAYDQNGVTSYCRDVTGGTMETCPANDRIGQCEINTGVSTRYFIYAYTNADVASVQSMCADESGTYSAQ
jgi:hypothetical protein